MFYKNQPYHMLDGFYIALQSFLLQINLKICPDPRIVNKTSGPISATVFQINGFLIDSFNSEPIKNGEISVHLLDGVSDISKNVC